MNSSREYRWLPPLAERPTVRLAAEVEVKVRGDKQQQQQAGRRVG